MDLIGPWVIGFLFVLGLAGDEVDGFWKGAALFFFWPIYLGEYVAEKLKDR